MAQGVRCCDGAIINEACVFSYSFWKTVEGLGLRREVASTSIARLDAPSPATPRAGGL